MKRQNETKEMPHRNKHTRLGQDGEISTEIIPLSADEKRVALMKQRAELCDIDQYNKVIAAVKAAEWALEVVRASKYSTSDTRTKSADKLKEMKSKCDAYARMCCVFGIVVANLLQLHTVKECTMTPQEIEEDYARRRSSLSLHWQNVFDNDSEKLRRYIITLSCDDHNIDLQKRCCLKVGRAYLDPCQLLTFTSWACKRGAIRTMTTWKPIRCCKYATRLVWRGMYPVTSSCEYDGAFTMLINNTQHTVAPTGTGWCLNCEQKTCPPGCKKEATNHLLVWCSMHA